MTEYEYKTIMLFKNAVLLCPGMHVAILHLLLFPVVFSHKWKPRVNKWNKWNKWKPRVNIQQMGSLGKQVTLGKKTPSDRAGGQFCW